MTELQIVGEAVLRDYPLRIWARQQEHTEAMLREFNLLLIGEKSGEARRQAPGQLVELAESFTVTYGPLVERMTEERMSALERGLDRIDSRVPLPAETPALLDSIEAVLKAVDEYCAAGDMLTLARPPEIVAFYDWTTTEILAQYNGAQPTPWPGPF